MTGRILHKPTQNFGARPAGVKPDLIIIHGTAGSDAGDVAWCQKTKADHDRDYERALAKWIANGRKGSAPVRYSPVSYHDIILRTGECVHMVDYDKRAWHAGVSSWEGRDNCNDYAIGVAISNYPGEKPTDAQYDMLGYVVAQLMIKFEIPMQRVVGHYHVSPGRKTDPWPPFDWERLWRAVGAPVLVAGVNALVSANPV